MGGRLVDERTELKNSKPVSQVSDDSDFVRKLSIVNARPVVPLERIKKLKHKRKLFLFATFALAMLLGAASGLLTAYIQLRAVSESQVIEADVLTSPVSEQPLPSSVTQEFFTNNALANAAFRLPSGSQQPKVVPSKRVSTKPRRAIRNSQHSAPLPSLSEHEELQKIREALLIDDSKKRRLRRPSETRRFP